MLGLLACLIFVPGAYSIEVGFSAEDGGDSTSLSSSYDVDTDVSVSEESTANFGQPAIENTRSVSGTGKIEADQSYSGSSGYSGSAIFKTESGSLTGSACLTPVYTNALMNLAAKGNTQFTLTGTHGHDSATQEGGVKDGNLVSSSSLTIGHSVFISENTNLVGNGGFVRGSAVNGDNIARTSVDVDGSLSSNLYTAAKGYVENSQNLNAAGSFISANAYAKEGSISTQFDAKVLDEGRPASEKVSGSLYSEAGSPQTAIGDLMLQGDKITFGTTSTSGLGTYTSSQTKTDVVDPLHKQSSSVATEGYMLNTWDDEGKGKIEPINQVIDISTPESNKKITNTVEGEGTYKIDGSSIITEDGASFLQNINSEGSIQDNIEIESHSEPLIARGYTYASKSLLGFKSAQIQKGASSSVFMSQNYLATGDVKQSAEAETIDGHSLTSVVIDDESILTLPANLATTALASYNLVGSETYRRTRVTQDVTQATFIPANSLVSGAFAEYGDAQSGGLSDKDNVKSATAVSSVKDANSYDLSLSAETVKSAVAEQEIKTTGGDIKTRTFSMDSDLRGAAKLIKEAYPEMASVLPRYGLLRTLIIKGGYGPNTGVTADADAAFWKKVLEQEGFETEVKNWNDLTSDPNIDEYLNSRNLIIFTSGGYWYSLDQDAAKLEQIHNKGIPTIFVAPDINYDWGQLSNVIPSFAKDVLHIDGALGIMPGENYNVYADTGHPITSGLPNSITVPAVNSYPDSFKPYNGGQGVLSQGYMYSEFGVGSLASQPSGSHYDPNTYAVVAYPGSSTEGRSVLFGFVPAGLQSDIATKLAQNTVDWAATLPASIVPKSDISKEASGNVEKFQAHLSSHSYPEITHDGVKHDDEFASYATVGVKKTNADAQITQIAHINGQADVEKDVPVRVKQPDDQTPWGIEMMYGDNKNLQKTSGGNGIDVAVIDTGADTLHPDLAMRIEDYADFAPVSGSTPHVGEYSTPSNNYEGSHGTHVAGIIAADSGFDGKGIWGMAPGADLNIYKIANNVPDYTAQVPNAIYRATDLGSEIISMSNGYDGTGRLFDNAIQYATDNGVLVVAAAGNGISEGDSTIIYPASNGNVVAVGAVNNKGNAVWWTSPGLNDNNEKIAANEVMFGAPGDDILSTVPRDAGWYDKKKGTSMATPHISGLAAKLWSKNLVDGYTAKDIKNNMQNLAKQNDVQWVTLSSDIWYPSCDLPGARNAIDQFLKNPPTIAGAGTSPYIYYHEIYPYTDLTPFIGHPEVLFGTDKDFSLLKGEDCLTGLGIPKLPAGST